MDLVVKVGQGGLYQGGQTDVEALETSLLSGQTILGLGDPSHILLVLAAEELDIDPKASKIEGFKVPLFDTNVPLKEQLLLAKFLSPVVSALVKALKTDKKVLVCCAQGLNRSGLVVGLCLRSLGYTGPDALKLIRDARGQRALFNKSFEEMVLRG